MEYSLTVLVPFFNEEAYLQTSLDRLLDSNILITKIILINDGSTDNSLQIAEHYVSNHKNIDLINLDKNGGKGVALSSGLKNVSTSHVVIQDADLEYNPKDLKNLIRKSIEDPGCLVLGSRFLGKEFRKNLYIRTYIANKFLSKLFSIVYRVKLTDIASCYKIIPYESFKNYDFMSKGFTIEIELLTKFLKSSNRIFELPISYRGRSYKEGKKIKLLDGFKYIFTIFYFKKI